MIGKFDISKTSLGDRIQNHHFTKGELMANKKPTGKYMLFTVGWQVEICWIC